MAHESMLSKIMELNKMYGLPPVKDESPDRYDVSTNTLYSEEKKGVTKKSEAGYAHHDVIFEENEYNEIISDKRHFLVVKNEEIKVRENITIRETKNLMPTGRVIVKEITQVATAKDYPGIKEGYSVISW